MARRSEFVEHVVELMRSFGAVEPKSMFGGWGLSTGKAWFDDIRLEAMGAADQLPVIAEIDAASERAHLVHLAHDRQCNPQVQQTSQCD